MKISFYRNTKLLQINRINLKLISICYKIQNTSMMYTKIPDIHTCMNNLKIHIYLQYFAIHISTNISAYLFIYLQIFTWQLHNVKNGKKTKTEGKSRKKLHLFFRRAERFIGRLIKGLDGHHMFFFSDIRKIGTKEAILSCMDSCKTLYKQIFFFVSSMRKMC